MSFRSCTLRSNNTIRLILTGNIITGRGIDQ